MTSRERFLAAAGGQKPDKVPAAPYNGNFGAAFAGMPISIYNTSADRMAEAQIKTWEYLGQDVVVAQSDNYYIAEGFGCVINQPFNTTPNLVQPAVETLGEIGRLKVPDPYKDGRMHIYLDAVHNLRRHFGAEVALRGPGTGPFSLASYLVGGTEFFLMEIATAEADEDKDKERRLLDLMEISTEALIAFSLALLEAGSDTAQAGDSLASLSMISPAIYDKYVYPYECKFFNAVNPAAHAKGGATILHICGDTRKILPRMARTGADILEIDAKVDMAEAKTLTEGRVTLLGNLEPTVVLFQGTPDLVRKEAEDCMRSCRALEGRFILGSGCEVVPKSPPENLKAFVDTAHGFAG
jgi:uroporphyrinogen decarboxylase